MLLFAFARRADVDGQRRLARRQNFGGIRSAEAFSERDQVWPRFEAAQSVLQISSHMIEPNAPEADGRFVLAARVSDDDDGMRAIQHGSGPCGVLAAETNVDAALQVRGPEFVGI